MSSIIIRAAAISDIPQIQRIYAFHVLNGLGTFEEIPPSEQEMIKRFNSIQQLNYPYLVAELEQQIIGFAYVNLYHARSAYRYTVEDSIYIAHGFHGQGVGRRMLNTLVDSCRKLEIKQMIALIGDSNNSASISMHKSLGFAKVGVLNNVGYKFNTWVDVVLMQLSL